MLGLNFRAVCIFYIFLCFLLIFKQISYHIYESRSRLIMWHVETSTSTISSSQVDYLYRNHDHQDNKQPPLSTYKWPHIQVKCLLCKSKNHFALCPLPFALCERQNWQLPLFENLLLQRGGCFLNPFEIGAATFLAFNWYRCGCFLRGKLALVKGWLLVWDPFRASHIFEINISKGMAAFWDPFEIGVAAFLEISISNCVFHI